MLRVMSPRTWISALPAAALVGTVVLASACAGRDQEPRRPALLVFAAASLRDVAEELAAAFETRHAVEAVFNFAGSNTLAQQIHAAPSADVFLSADGQWVDDLDEAGRTVAGTRRPFLSNRLAVIAQRDSDHRVAAPRDLARTDYRFLALADPEGVPAGRYARAYLERVALNGNDLWTALAGRVAPALDVRAALALVESDPEILGIVYRTDAVSSPRVKVLYEFPPAGELPIVYWATLVDGGESPDAGRLFLDFLVSPVAREISERHGFAAVGG